MFRRRRINQGGWVTLFILNARVVSATNKPQWLRQRSSTALESESRFFKTCYGDTCRDDNEFKSSIGLSCIAHKAWIRDTGEDCFTRWLTSSWMQDVYSNDDVFQVIEHCPCTCRVDCTADIMSNLQQVKALVSANTAKVKATSSLSPSSAPSISPTPAPSLPPSRKRSEATSLESTIISNVEGGTVTPSPTSAPTQVVRSESPSLKAGGPSPTSSANVTIQNHSLDLPTLDKSQNSTDYTAESRSYQPPEASPLSEKQFGLKDIIAIVGSVAAGGAVLLVFGFVVATSMARRRVRKKRRRKRRKRRSDDEYPRRKRRKEEYVRSATRSGGSSKSKRRSKKKRGKHRSDETFASDISPSPLRNGPALFDDTGNTVDSEDFIYSGRRGRRW